MARRKKGALEPVDKRVPVFGPALPYDNYVVADGLEGFDFARVARLVGRQLLRPEVGVSRRNLGQLASLVMMPEASVREDRPALPLIGEIGRAGERPHVAAVSQADRSASRCNSILRRRPTLSHALHQRATSRVGFEPARHWTTRPRSTG